MNASVASGSTTLSTTTASPGPGEPDTVYGRVFWFAFAANLTMVAANSMTFRFAELVASLGGSEQNTGEIVRTGMLGTIVARLFLGPLFDRYGTRIVWLICTALYGSSCLAFLSCESVGWPIHAIRIAFATGLAGMSTAALVHLQQHIPHHRRTEVIGNFGSSGFIGMALGSQLSDIVYRGLEPDWRFNVLFGVPAALALVFYSSIVLGITRGVVHERPAESPGVHRLIFRYWPGVIVLVSISMGITFTAMTVFLTRMTTGRGIGGIGPFFLGYCASAFLFRVASSQWSARYGRRKLLLMGLAGHAIGQTILAHATSQWGLLIPALCGGFGHAMLFPSVVSLGSGSFPRSYRGTGTTLVLGFHDVGTALSAPVLGWIIDHSRSWGFADPFAPMYHASAFCAALIAVLYAWWSRGHLDDELRTGTGPGGSETAPTGQTASAGQAASDGVTASNGAMTSDGATASDQTTAGGLAVAQSRPARTISSERLAG